MANKNIAKCVLAAQSCLVFCDPMGCSLPGSPVHGVLQARILEWVAIPFQGNLSDPAIEPRSPALCKLATKSFVFKIHTHIPLSN